MKHFLTTCAAVLIGFMLGAAIYHPKPVHAVAGVFMTKARVGLNAPPGESIVGFACTQQECFVLSQ